MPSATGSAAIDEPSAASTRSSAGSSAATTTIVMGPLSLCPHEAGDRPPRQLQIAATTACSTTDSSTHFGSVCDCSHFVRTITASDTAATAASTAQTIPLVCMAGHHHLLMVLPAATFGRTEIATLVTPAVRQAS